MPALSGLAHRLSGTRLSSLVAGHLPDRLRAALIARVLDQPDVNWPIVGPDDLSLLEAYEYSLFSQNGEDGILRRIFDVIGPTDRQFVEFGFGARQNNSMRLAMKDGFNGVFVDGDRSTVNCFNHVARLKGLDRVRAVEAFVDMDNLVPVLQSAGVSPGLDLLSIDVDGNDYWFWDVCASTFSPRVAAIEYNAGFGPDLICTIPYRPSFRRFDFHESGFYHGASLGALTRVGAKNGYELVGCDSNGVNAFFVRRDCAPLSLPPVPVRDAYRPHRMRLERGFPSHVQQQLIEGLPLVDLENGGA